MRVFISARNALPLFKSPDRIRDALYHGDLGFYIKYVHIIDDEGSTMFRFSDRLTGLYKSHYNNFYNEMDCIILDYNELLCYILKNNIFKALDIEYYPEPFESLYYRNLYKLQDKIAEQEKEIASLRANETQASSLEANSLQDFFSTYPIVELLFELHKAGKDRTAIIKYVTGEGNFATNLQVGWLTKRDKRLQSDEALKREIYRLKSDKK